MKQYTFELEQDGLVVATATCSDRAAALREICHYARVYAQDGECTIKGASEADWTLITTNQAKLFGLSTLTRIGISRHAR